MSAAAKVVPPEKDWEFIAKMTLIVRDILYGNPKLDALGWHEEALGKNAVAGGFQGQRQWTDWLPNGDFTEAIMASTFDWNGPKQPTAFATENDTMNGVAMLLGTLVSHTAPCFHDVRTYWSPEAVTRVTGWKPEGAAAGGFIHLINSGATALDCTGAAQGRMKPFWEMTQAGHGRVPGGHGLVPGQLPVLPGRWLLQSLQNCRPKCPLPCCAPTLWRALGWLCRLRKAPR